MVPSVEVWWYIQYHRILDQFLHHYDEQEEEQEQQQRIHTAVQQKQQILVPIHPIRRIHSTKPCFRIQRFVGIAATAWIVLVSCCIAHDLNGLHDLHDLYQLHQMHQMHNQPLLQPQQQKQQKHQMLTRKPQEATTDSFQSNQRLWHSTLACFGFVGHFTTLRNPRVPTTTGLALTHHQNQPYCQNHQNYPYYQNHPHHQNHLHQQNRQAYYRRTCHFLMSLPSQSSSTLRSFDDLNKNSGLSPVPPSVPPNISSFFCVQVEQSKTNSTNVSKAPPPTKQSTDSSPSKQNKSHHDLVMSDNGRWNTRDNNHNNNHNNHNTKKATSIHNTGTRSNNSMQSTTDVPPLVPLDAKPSNNDRNENLMHFASKNKAPLEMVQFLHNQCPDLVRQLDSNGCYPLHYASAMSSSTTNLNADWVDVVAFLIQKFPPALVHPDNSRLRVPLHFAVDINAKDTLSRHQLPSSFLTVVQKLLEACPESIQMRDRDGQTPLDLARTCCNSDVVDLMLKYDHIVDDSHHDNLNKNNINSKNTNPIPPWPSKKQSSPNLGIMGPSTRSNSISTTFGGKTRQHSKSFHSSGGTGSGGGGRLLQQQQPQQQQQRPLDNELYRSLYQQLTDELDGQRPDWDVVRDLLTQNTKAVRLVGKFHKENLMHFACGKNAPLQMIHFLYNLCPELVTKADDDGRYPLHDACIYLQSFDVIEYLIQKFPQASMHKEMKYEYLPLHCACKAGQTLDVVQLLIETYPDSLFLTNNNGETPLDVAKISQHDTIAQLLEDYMKERKRIIYEKNKVMITLPSWIKRKQTSDLDAFESSRTNSGSIVPTKKTLPFYAQQSQQPQQPRESSNGSDDGSETTKSDENNDSDNYKMEAYKSMYQQLLYQLEKPEPDWNALRITVRILINSSTNDAASQKIVNDMFRKANLMHIACGKKRAPLQFIKFLHGFCPDLTSHVDEYGRYPLHDACIYRQSLEVIEFLLRNTVMEPSQQSTAAMQLLLHQESKYQYTPLHCACQSGQSLDVIELLLMTCPEAATVPNSIGETPLDVALRCNHLSIAQMVEDYAMAGQLQTDDLGYENLDEPITSSQSRQQLPPWMNDNQNHVSSNIFRKDMMTHVRQSSNNNHNSNIRKRDVNKNDNDNDVLHAMAVQQHELLQAIQQLKLDTSGQLHIIDTAVRSMETRLLKNEVKLRVMEQRFTDDVQRSMIQSRTTAAIQSQTNSNNNSGRSNREMNQPPDYNSASVAMFHRQMQDFEKRFTNQLDEMEETNAEAILSILEAQRAEVAERNFRILEDEKHKKWVQEQICDLQAAITVLLSSSNHNDENNNNSNINWNNNRNRENSNNNSWFSSQNDNANGKHFFSVLQRKQQQQQQQITNSMQPRTRDEYDNVVPYQGPKVQLRASNIRSSHSPNQRRTVKGKPIEND